MLLEVSSVSKSFEGANRTHPVLRDAQLRLDIGETLALTGESGSGKSTLLTLIAGLDTPDTGVIQLKGQNIHAMSDTHQARFRRDSIGLIFQQFNLVPSLTVAENLSFQARLSGRFDPSRTTHLAEVLGLSDQLQKYPEHLSGGQQQRVAIGRAIAGQPELILADEPTGNLDEETSDNVLKLLLDLVSEHGTALLMVTHSLRLADSLGRQVHLSNGRLT